MCDTYSNEMFNNILWKGSSLGTFSLMDNFTHPAVLLINSNSISNALQERNFSGMPYFVSRIHEGIRFFSSMAEFPS